MLGFFSFILMYLHVDTHTHMRIHLNFKYDMIIALLCAGIYAYICSMGKDRVFALNQSKEHARSHAIADGTRLPRGCRAIGR